jgi:hypothetical protein
MESIGTSQAAERFGTEMLFVEEGAEFWLPVQDVLLPHFRKELKAGERVTVLANWIGITSPESDGSRQHVFLINEFEKSVVSSAARAAAAPWGTLTGPDGDFTVDFPAEPRRDEFQGRVGSLARSYTVHMDTLMLVLASEDLGYGPGRPLADSISPAFEREVRAASKRDGWKIVRVQRLSRSAAEVEAWERSRDPKGYVHSIARTHIRNGRVYDLQCRSLHIGREVDRSTCNRFLSSFRVTRPPR